MFVYVVIALCFSNGASIGECHFVGNDGLGNFKPYNQYVFFGDTVLKWQDIYIYIEETAKASLYPFSLQYLSSPSVIPVHSLLQPFLKATYWLSTYYMSIQFIPVLLHRLWTNLYPCQSWIQVFFFLFSLYPLPRLLSWLLISITWSVFSLLIPFTHSSILVYTHL